MQPPGQDCGSQFPVYTTTTYWLGYTWTALRHLHELMQSNAFDVVDFPEYGAEGFAYQLDRVPWNWAAVAVQLHGPLAMFARHIGWPDGDCDFYRVGAFMEGVSIKLADGLMACSANIADFTAEFYGVSRDSIDVVHCGVDAEAFRPEDEPECRPAEPVLLFVGNIAANKGVDTVFEAVMRLRSKYPGIRLRILGKCDDSLAEEFKSRARGEGAGANIELRGFVDRAALPEIYRRADVFCSPAQHEVGVANVYIEAMACGCPVVACTTGAAPEAVMDGQTGILVPPRDVEALTAALERLFSDSSLRRRMGEAGRRRVEEYFAMDKYILRVLGVYEKTIERSRLKLRELRYASREAEFAGGEARP